jgi:uncharacterized protein (DUF1330 family)
MQLRALVVRTFCTRRPRENPWPGRSRGGPNHVDSLRDLLATLRLRWRCEYGGQVTVYAIAQLKFTDRNAYDRYQSAFMEVFLRHSGTVLAADEAPQIIEGQWDRDKVVLMKFPDETAFREWAESPDYQRISNDRRAGADTVVLLVQALSREAT